MKKMRDQKKAPVSKWLITMVNKPLSRVAPLPNGLDGL